MLICIECDRTFDPLEADTFQLTPDSERETVCPSCGSGHIDACVSCTECGEHNAPEANPICRDCESLAIDNKKRCRNCWQPRDKWLVHGDTCILCQLNEINDDIAKINAGLSNVNSGMQEVKEALCRTS